MYERNLNYIKCDFVKNHLDNIINIKLAENYDKGEYFADIHLNYKYDYKHIKIDKMNYKLYENLFNWIFINNWKFPFMINIIILKNRKIERMEI